jgi:hypothetical protein
MRSMVEGASDLSLRRRRKSGVESDAPSTTLRVVPLPRFRGAGEKERAAKRYLMERGS